MSRTPESVQDPNAERTSGSVAEEIESLRQEVQQLRKERDQRPPNPDQTDGDRPDKQNQAAPPRRSFIREHPLKTLLGLILIVAAAIGGFRWWQYTQTYESTDDAQIDGHMNLISARISGTVIAVHVTENQVVKPGDLLMELDPADYQVALERAEAGLSQAEAQIRMETPSVPITATTTQTQISTTRSGVANATAAIAAAQRDYDAQLGRVAQAEANNARAQADLDRYSMLVKKDQVSKEEYDQKVAAAKAASAMVETERSAAQADARVVEQRQAALEQATSQLDQATRNAPQQVLAQRATVDLKRAGAQAARAAVDEAKLNLTYTKIFAPIGGIVGKKSVEVGQRVQPGQQLVSIIPLDDIWITANFKETQLLHMSVGQKAVIHVDAYDRDYDGYVESMPPATGAQFSVLPPENASGNYVKVVQRLPVRLRFKQGVDPEHKLRTGMSVVPKVSVK